MKRSRVGGGVLLKVIAAALLASIAGFGLLGCELELNNEDERVVTADSTNTGNTTSGGSDGGSNSSAISNTVTGSGTVDSPYVLNSNVAETLYAKDNAFDIYKYGGKNGEVANLADAKLCWKNPLAGAENVTGVTISFDLYANTTGTYSGVLGFYNKNNAGFLWITNTQWFLNTTANVDKTSASFSYTDAVSIGAVNGEWKKITIVADANGVTTYCDGSKVGDTLTKLEGVTTAISALCDFLTSGDVTYISAGNGVAFWNNAGYESSALANIKIYSTALTEAQVAALQ